ncbi:MAG TPA: hypothetical protein VMT00_05370 [Thermoanaerobaculia bacterium]|nr:hypothetical protein [Thermoanaerobaculia bacterium]
MLRTGQIFDEIAVYEGIAERTGNTADRSAVAGRKGVCRSLSELGRKARRLGDGYYYLPALVWPEGVRKLALKDTWVTFGSSE